MVKQSIHLTDTQMRKFILIEIYLIMRANRKGFKYKCMLLLKKGEELRRQKATEET